MTSTLQIEQLNDAIDLLLADPQARPNAHDHLDDLVELAAELRYLPGVEFKVSLGAELQEQAAAMCAAAADLFLVEPAAGDQHADSDFAVLPTLLSDAYGNYPVHGTSFALSFLAHAAAVVLLATSGWWVAQHRTQLKASIATVLTDPGRYALPPAPDEARGGGGGGDADRLAASKGSPPRYDREQFTPPAIVIRNQRPTLTVEPTLVGPPQLTFPITGPTGLPTAALAPPSNGAGTGGGVGTGIGGGMGSGNGPGFGPGVGGGMGGGVYRVGGGVSAPRVLYDPDPDYSDAARKARYQGTVVLWAVIGPDGRARDLRVARSLGMGLDEKAIEAVQKWRFAPALLDGRPVAVQISIEVSFRLY